MKRVDPIEFGIRVRDCRKGKGWGQAKLAELSGQSQTNIGWLEKGRAKNPRRAVQALSEALRVHIDYLLYGTGPKDIGPPIWSVDDLGENYSGLSLQDQAEVTAFVAQRVAAAKEKSKTG